MNKICIQPRNYFDTRSIGWTYAQEMPHLIVGLHADHGEAGLLHEGARGHGTGPMVDAIGGLAGHSRPVVLAVGTPRQAFLVRNPKL